LATKTQHFIKKSRLFNKEVKNSRMKRYLDERVRQDLQKKLVVLTGPRQVGKTTLSRQLVAELWRVPST
jgi:predicted AAA+ superfamily ATPase